RASARLSADLPAAVGPTTATTSPLPPGVPPAWADTRSTLVGSHSRLGCQDGHGRPRAAGPPSTTYGLRSATSTRLPQGGTCENAWGGLTRGLAAVDPAGSGRDGPGPEGQDGHMNDWTSYGRIDADGTVYVKTADGERVVGSWQAGTPEEGLAHFARRFADLVTEVDLIESRLAGGVADPTQ